MSDQQGQQNQGQQPNWRDSLPAELQTEPSLADFKDVGSLAKSYVHTKRLVGADKIPLPADDAPPEMWAEVFNRLGRPADPSGYQIGAPEDMPEGFKYSPEMEADFRKMAHELGLTKKQATQMWNNLNGKAIDTYKSIIESRGQKLSTETEALKKEWGEAYEPNLKLAQRAANALEQSGIKGLNEWLKKSGAGAEPMIQRLLATVGKYAKEDQLGPGEPSMAMTPKEAATKVKAILYDDTNPKHKAYMDKRHPNHRAIVDEVQALLAKTGDIEI
jgi:hypothetical protein